MPNSSFSIIEFAPHYTDSVVRLWRESMQAAIGIPPIHSFDSQAYFLREILPYTNRVYIAIDQNSGQPIGFMATDGDWLNQLYVSINHQGKGVGSALLKIAKQSANGALLLRTFEVNTKAQVFYEKSGFVAIGGDSDNEEGLPDIIYRWQTRLSV